MREKTIFNELFALCSLANFQTGSTHKLRFAVQEECFKLNQVSRTFNDNRQHDAAEFLNSSIEHLFGKNNHLKEEVFGGLCQKTLFCQCSQTDTLQIENCPEILPLEIIGTTLEECIEHFLSPQEIERRCPNCQSEASTQVSSFIKNPRTLIFQLNRFEFHQHLNRVSKKHNTLLIPKSFQLPLGASYKLKSIINHVGETPYSGHYTCLLSEHEEDLFVLVDDENIVRSVRFDENLSQQAYIITYVQDIDG